MSQIQFAVVGAGWRAEYFFRIARALPRLFEIVGVVARNPKRRQELERKWGFRSFADLKTMAERSKPQFVVTCVHREANVSLVRELCDLKIPVLSETPPAPDLDGLIELNSLVRKGAKIQVAEQYHFQPLHAARLQAIEAGLVGTVSHAQVSVAHGYHAMNLLRRLLKVEFEQATITGSTFASPLVQGPGLDGPPEEWKVETAEQQFFHLDFGNALGIYDFTTAQYFSWIRNDRMLIRGEKGEIVNKELVYLKDHETPIHLNFIRHEAGPEGNLEGNYLKGIQLGDTWVYRNPFAPASLSDDEIAGASCLTGMARYVAGGEPVYSLADASQDQYLALLCQQALDQRRAIRTEAMPWARVRAIPRHQIG